MERHEIDELECEANGHTPHNLKEQLESSQKRVVVRTAIQEIIDWSQVEPGQTPFWPNHTRSINSLR